VIPVRYELDSYKILRRNTIFKKLNIPMLFGLQRVHWVTVKKEIRRHCHGSNAAGLSIRPPKEMRLNFREMETRTLDNVHPTATCHRRKETPSSSSASLAS
jgi:hypothetical protein